MGTPHRPIKAASGFRRVHKVGNGFVASIAVHSEKWSLGTWPSAEQAAVAVDRASLYFGVEERGLNLPRKSRRLGPASPGDLIVESRRLRKRTHATSRYFGVFQDQTRGHWITCFSVGGYVQRVARSDTELEAAIAYDRLARYYPGSKGNLNFPRRRLKPCSIEQLQKEREAHYAGLKTAPYRGVIHVAESTKYAWRACINLGTQLSGTRHRTKWLGSWKTAAEAAIAYDRAALYYHGDRAKINFARSRKLGPLDAESLTALARREQKKSAYSRFRGVTYDKSRGKWAARLETGGRCHHLGFFDSEEPAAVTYDKEARRVFGDRAKLNFHPHTGEELLGRRVKLTK